MKDFLIKRAVEETDWQELRRVRLHALQSHPDVYGSNFASESSRTEQDWRNILKLQTMRVFGTFDNNLLVGIAGAYDWRCDETGKTACLGMWYMAPEHRKSGAFTDLVKLTIAWAIAQERYDRIVVSHREGNNSSKSVNQKLGFQYFMSRADQWPDGQTQDNHFYELRIK